jgi:hypothetical protein
MLKTPMNHSAASAECQHLGGQLAIISDESSHDAVYNFTGKSFSLCLWAKFDLTIMDKTLSKIAYKILCGNDDVHMYICTYLCM